MTDDQNRAARIAAFDQEADRPRAGWSGPTTGFAGVEVWTREAAGLSLSVTGIGPGAGYWRFAVRAGDDVVSEGESSRRGWAMDGADDEAAARLN